MEIMSQQPEQELSAFEVAKKEYLHAQDSSARMRLLVTMESSASSVEELKVLQRFLIDDSPLKKRVEFRINELEHPQPQDGKAA